MKRFIISFFLSISVISTVSANTVGAPTLQQAFDELNYSLSVEWDQSDMDFYESKRNEFLSKIESLREKGVSNKELIEFGLRGVKNKKLALEMQSALNLIEIKKLSNEEAHKIILDSIEKTYSTGASWVGDAILTFGGIFAFVFVLSAVFNSNESSTGSSGGYRCYEYKCAFGLDYKNDLGYYCNYVYICNP